MIVAIVENRAWVKVDPRAVDGGLFHGTVGRNSFWSETSNRFTDCCSQRITPWNKVIIITGVFVSSVTFRLERRSFDRAVFRELKIDRTEPKLSYGFPSRFETLLLDKEIGNSRFVSERSSETRPEESGGASRGVSTRLGLFRSKFNETTTVT